MGMAGGWSCIVRFALHIPLGIVGISGSNLSGAISPLKATGIYDVVPHGRSFLYGVRMYSNWGVFAFAWNFVMFLGCFGCDGWLLVLLGLVDSLIAGSLLASVVLQGGFIPRTYGACHGATSWRDGADGRNYFATANATVFQHYGQPPAFCRVLVQTWAVAISCGILYAFTGVINLAIGLGRVWSEHGSERHRYPPPYRPPRLPFAQRVKRMGLDLVGLLAGLLRWLLSPLFLLVDHAVATCRFASRYGRRRRAIARARRATRREMQAGVGPQPVSRESKDPGLLAKILEVAVDEDADSAGRPPRLPYEILLMIAPQLHYVDLVSASQASRGVRTALFGDELIVATKLRDLQQFTCDKGPKTKCELCGNQTCKSCESRLATAPSAASLHRAQCVPYCSQCYYARCCRRSRRQREHRRSCPIAPARRGDHDDIELGPPPATGHQHPATRSLCRVCAAMEPAARRERLEERDRPDVAHKGLAPQTTCGWCGGVLARGGPRWWVCQPCRTECDSELHPLWGEK